MRAAALVPLLLRGTHAEETAEQRYVRAARARCPPPPPGDDLYDWRRGQEARASLLDARAAVEAYACLLDACVAAPGGVERCRLSAAAGCAGAQAAHREMTTPKPLLIPLGLCRNLLRPETDRQ